MPILKKAFTADPVVLGGGRANKFSICRLDTIQATTTMPSWADVTSGTSTPCQHNRPTADRQKCLPRTRPGRWCDRAAAGLIPTSVTGTAISTNYCRNPTCQQGRQSPVGLQTACCLARQGAPQEFGCAVGLLTAFQKCEGVVSLRRDHTLHATIQRRITTLSTDCRKATRR